MHFWIPLQEANLENGCMQFIPGSHREGLVPHAQKGPKAHMLTIKEPYPAPPTVCPAQAGGCTVRLPTTLHYTGPNETAKVRRACIPHLSDSGRSGRRRPEYVLASLRSLFRRLDITSRIS